MKKIIVLGLCVSILMATSCSQTSTSATTEESCSVENTTVHSSQSISTTATTTTEFTYEEYIPAYDVDQTFLNVTFEDVYNLCEEWTGVDFDELVQNTDDNTVIYFEKDGYKVHYIADYSRYINLICLSDNSYHPEEYEYHIIRSLYINGLFINEFENDYWAKFQYCQNFDFYSDEGCILVESDLTSGYFYSYIEDIQKYFGYHISNNVVLHYEHSMNRTDNSDFITYLEICNRFGLPTSIEMIDEIGT